MGRGAPYGGETPSTEGDTPLLDSKRAAIAARLVTSQIVRQDLKKGLSLFQVDKGTVPLSTFVDQALALLGGEGGLVDQVDGPRAKSDGLVEQVK